MAGYHKNQADPNTIFTMGFLCEFDEKTAKFYTAEYGLVELENVGVEGAELELAAWYDLCDGCYDFRDEEIEICKPYVEDGVVHVKTMAITPNNFLLPQEIWTKYYMKVWSPYLKYLNDASDKFRDNIRGGDVREVICKYAPSEEGVFEILDYIDEEVRIGVASCRLTPWTLEFIASKMDRTALPEGEEYYRLISRYQFSRPTQDQISIGICIFHSYWNIAFCRPVDSKKLPKPGSREICSYIWSPNMGLVRWSHGDEEFQRVVVHPDTHERASTSADGEPTGDMGAIEHRLGEWVAFQVNDSSQKSKAKSKNVTPTPSLFRLTATKLKLLDTFSRPKVSRVVDGLVEVEASFIFNHNKLEDPKTRDLEDWDVRHRYLKKDAHFWDFELGKVEIYPGVSKQIIETIESYRNLLSPSEQERLKNEAIVVHGNTRVLRSWLSNFETYPKNGIFYLDAINVICYLNGGALIYKREGFN